MFRKICSAVITASVLIFLISFYACKSNSIIPISTIKDITGKVYGIYGYPQKDIVIRIGNKTAKTSTDGSFFIDNVQTPYDLYIKDSLHNTGYVYQGLTSDNISIPILPSEQPQSSQTSINVNYPTGLFQSNGKLIFTDEDYINAYGPAGSNGGTIFLYVPPGNPITGKVIVMLYSKSPNGIISSYDRFGLKDSITITTSDNINVNFTEQELSYNPNEKTLSYNLIPLPGYTVAIRILYLHFGTRQTMLFASTIEFEKYNSNTLSITIPEQLPASFIPVVFVYAENTNGSRDKEKFLLQSNSGNLQMHLPPELIYPPDNFQNADTNTIFTFNKIITEPGIVSVTFIDNTNNATYQIITDSENVTLQGLSTFGFGTLNGNSFTWSGTKIGEYQDVDEYLSSASNANKQFSSSSVSRTFTTKP